MTRRSLRSQQLFALFLALGAVLVPVSAAGAATSGAATISVLSTRTYGSVLVVGSGRLKGTPLYIFSGDGPGHLGCTTTLAEGYDLGPLPRVPLRCTGPESDFLEGVATDDWPAFTSPARPIAGPGVTASLLGSIERAGIGRQVTYAGHPLYLFDAPSKPFLPQGEGYMETVAPLAPWHGYWSLITTSGDADFGPAHLNEGKLPDGEHVLALQMDRNVMPLDVTVYARTTNGPCDASCARTWIPVFSRGPAVAGKAVPATLLSTRTLPGGAQQVTYHGRGLYLYAKERAFLAGGHLKASGTAGNGNRQAAPDGGLFVRVPLG